MTTVLRRSLPLLLLAIVVVAIFAAVLLLREQRRIATGISVERRPSQLVYLKWHPSQQFDLYLLDVPEQVVTPLTQNGRVRWAEWTPNGDRLVLYLDDETYALLHVATGELSALGGEWGTPDESLALARGAIALVENKDGRPTIFVYGSDGGNRQELTPGTHPSWSPDGRRLAFSAQRDGDADAAIYVVDADGGNVVQVAQLEGGDEEPTWSPDGRTIAFRHVSLEDGGGLFTVDVDGGEPRRLASGGLSDMAWSRDGRYLAYLGPVAWDTNSGIRTVEAFVVDAGGEGVAELGKISAVQPMVPTWAPQSAVLAFTGEGDAVCTAAHEQWNPECVAGGLFPAWSPDGTELAFHTWGLNDAHLCIVTVATGHTYCLEEATAGGRYPRWRP